MNERAYTPSEGRSMVGVLINAVPGSTPALYMYIIWLSPSVSTPQINSGLVLRVREVEVELSQQTGTVYGAIPSKSSVHGKVVMRHGKVVKFTMLLSLLSVPPSHNPFTFTSYWVSGTSPMRVIEVEEIPTVCQAPAATGAPTITLSICRLLSALLVVDSP